MANQKDSRVIKTRKALSDAMLFCLKEKRFEDISVQYICQCAKVNRATFYTHFADKYNLFAYTAREVYQKFPSYRNLGAENINQRKVCLRLVEDLVNFFVEQEEIIRSMQDSDLTVLMFNIIATEIQKDLEELLGKEIQAVTDFSPELVISFQIRGTLGTCMWWLSTGMPISKEDLIRQLRGLLVV